MRILVTGGAGFIGSHLCEALLRRGDAVVVLDNFDPFYPRSEKEANLRAVRAAAPREESLRIVEGDIRRPEDLDRAFAGGIDAVVHLAALAGVRPSLEQPARYAEVNIGGTTAVLEAMRRHGPRRLVFASSSSVYGNNRKVPFAEDDCVDFPISPYAATKKAGELLCHSYHHLFGFQIACLRFFTVYGPRQRPDLAIRKFARLLLAGRPIEIYGDGSTRRDYTCIDDILQGLLAALDRLDGYRIYNLGESRTVELRELVRLLGAALGVAPRCETKPAQPGDVEQTWADVSRARAELGYAPAVPIEEGLERFAAWMRSAEGAR